MQSIRQNNPMGITSGDRYALVIAFVLLLFATYFLFIRSPDVVLREDAISIGKIRTTGTVRRRHSGNLSWSNINGDGTIYLRDSVYTPKEAAAEIFLETKSGSRRLQLEPDSMVQFDDVTMNKIEIVLRDRKEKDPDKPIVVTATQVNVLREAPVRILPYPKTSRLRSLSTEITAFEDELGKLTARVSSLSQRSPDLRPVTEIKIPVLSLAAVNFYELSLISPKEDKFDITVNPWIKMTWQSLPFSGVSYQLEISSDPYFKKPRLLRTEESSLSVTYNAVGTFYWRVRAERAGSSTLSPVSKFHVEKNPLRLVTGAGLPSVRKVPANYLWEVFQDSNFDRGLRNSISNDPICPIKELARGIYYCRIRDLATNKIVKEYPLEVP